MNRDHKKSVDTNEKNAIDLLITDHEKVTQLFTKFKKLKENEGSPEEKADVVKQICLELKIHMQLEEYLFYPAYLEATKDQQDLVDEAEVEHASAKELILQLELMGPEDKHYDAKVIVLGEYIDHHVKEEETEMFPKARKAKMDIETLTEQLLQRKQELKDAFQDMALTPLPKGRKPSASATAR